jgi:hypothetical protein
MKSKSLEKIVIRKVRAYALIDIKKKLVIRKVPLLFKLNVYIYI